MVIGKGVTGEKLQQTLNKDSKKKEKEVKKEGKQKPVKKNDSPPIPRDRGIVAQIIELYKSGKTNKEIVDLGFNRNTVARQVSEFKKRENAK